MVEMPVAPPPEAPVPPPVMTWPPPLGEAHVEPPLGEAHVEPSPAPWSMPVIPVDDAAKARADKEAAAKAALDKMIADQEHGAKVLGDMEAGIRLKLVTMSDEFGVEFTKLHTAYVDIPDEIKAHTMYKELGEKIASVEALFNTLMHTAASFPMPVVKDEHVPHGSL